LPKQQQNCRIPAHFPRPPDGQFLGAIGNTVVLTKLFLRMAVGKLFMTNKQYPRRDIMHNILKVTLASAMLLAGSSMAFAADGTSKGGGDHGGQTNIQKSTEQDQMDADTMNTGSIKNCTRQEQDAKGKCITTDMDHKTPQQ
jgi:hypothetical protein